MKIKERERKPLVLFYFHITGFLGGSLKHVMEALHRPRALTGGKQCVVLPDAMVMQARHRLHA